MAAGSTGSGLRRSLVFDAETLRRGGNPMGFSAASASPRRCLEAESDRDIHQSLTAGVGRGAFVAGAGGDLAERRRIREVHVVFGAERLYHLNGFWKSNRNVAVARSLILHSLEAENWQSMKRCRSKVLRPTLPTGKRRDS